MDTSDAISAKPSQCATTRMLRYAVGLGGAIENDSLAVEEPLEIAVAHAGRSTTIGVTLRTPGHDRALAIGYLLTEGIVSGMSDIRSVRLREAKGSTLPGQRVTVQLRPNVGFAPEAHERRFPISAACGACGKSALEALRIRRSGPLAVEPALMRESAIAGMVERMRAAQEGFEATGGLHAAARFDFRGALVAHAEDIGRHNALDKLIGAQLLAGNGDWAESALLVSGRLGYDLMQKAIAVGCPIIASVGAPSSFAVELANLFRITLVGFLRSERFNVYATPRRIRFSDPIA